MRTELEQTIAYYDRGAADYAKRTESIDLEPQLEQFVQLLDSFFPTRAPNYNKPLILDAGCGAGRDAAWLQGRGLEVVGVDLSSNLLLEAKKRQRDQVVLANFLKLPFGDRTFEGVWAEAALVHLETVADAVTALTEFARVLKPNGVLSLSVKTRSDSVETEWRSDSLSGEYRRFFRYYQAEELKKMLVGAGFSVSFLHPEKDVINRQVSWLRVRAVNARF
ncbi:MAG: methyltransferase domain-containing protein [Candidatus Pacebacteria bacterium]|nr:methyltransferase domain-containing protein [Candidatus Paceibacterota bacterium]